MYNQKLQAAGFLLNHWNRFCKITLPLTKSWYVVNTRTLRCELHTHRAEQFRFGRFKTTADYCSRHCGFGRNELTIIIIIMNINAIKDLCPNQEGNHVSAADEPYFIKFFHICGVPHCWQVIPRSSSFLSN